MAAQREILSHLSVKDRTEKQFKKRRLTFDQPFISEDDLPINSRRNNPTFHTNVFNQGAAICNDPGLSSTAGIGQSYLTQTRDVPNAWNGKFLVH